MRTLNSATIALLVGLSYGCAKDDDDDDDVQERTQTPAPSTADTAANADDQIAKCVETCVNDAAECAAACTGGGNCAAVCDSTFASCEQECQRIGK